MDKKPLQKAVRIAGGQTALAKALNVKQGHVWKWLNRTRKGVPPEYVIPIESETGVSRHDLRPDIFGPPPSGQVTPSADAAKRA